MRVNRGQVPGPDKEVGQGVEPPAQGGKPADLPHDFGHHINRDHHPAEGRCDDHRDGADHRSLLIGPGQSPQHDPVSGGGQGRGGGHRDNGAVSRPDLEGGGPQKREEPTADAEDNPELAETDQEIGHHLPGQENGIGHREGHQPAKGPLVALPDDRPAQGDHDEEHPEEGPGGDVLLDRRGKLVKPAPSGLPKLDGRQIDPAPAGIDPGKDRLVAPGDPRDDPVGRGLHRFGHGPCHHLLFGGPEHCREGGCHRRPEGPLERRVHVKPDRRNLGFGLGRRGSLAQGKGDPLAQPGFHGRRRPVGDHDGKLEIAVGQDIRDRVVGGHPVGRGPFDGHPGFVQPVGNGRSEPAAVPVHQQQPDIGLAGGFQDVGLDQGDDDHQDRRHEKEDQEPGPVPDQEGELFSDCSDERGHFDFRFLNLDFRFWKCAIIILILDL